MNRVGFWFFVMLLALAVVGCKVKVGGDDFDVEVPEDIVPESDYAQIEYVVSFAELPQFEGCALRGVSVVVGGVTIEGEFEDEEISDESEHIVSQRYHRDAWPFVEGEMHSVEVTLTIVADGGFVELTYLDSLAFDISEGEYDFVGDATVEVALGVDCAEHSARRYLIRSQTELQSLATMVAESEDGERIDALLVADIYFSTYPLLWQTIGTIDKPYVGTFDGGGHTIQNFLVFDCYYRDNDWCYVDYVGLFGAVKDSTIKNLLIKGAAAAEESSTKATGLFCGYIENSTMTACGAMSYSTIRDSFGSEGYVGGLIGEVGEGTVTMSACYNAGQVTGVGRAGGLVGHINGGLKLRGCYNAGVVSSQVYAGTFWGLVESSVLGSLSMINCCYRYIDGEYGMSGYKDAYGINSSVSSMNLAAGAEYFTAGSGYDTLPSLFGELVIGFK